MHKRFGLLEGVFWSCATVWWTAAGAMPTVLYDSSIETKVIGTPLTQGSSLLVDGRLRNTGGSAITNRLFFRPGSTSLSLAAGWLTAPIENRTIGVNIDMFDSANNLVASDLFQGFNGAVATSQLLATNLIAGAEYQLVLTGTALQAGRYAMTLAPGDVIPPVPPVSIASPAADAALFDTLFGTKLLGRNFVDGDQFFIDGTTPGDVAGAIINDFRFNSTGGTLSAGIEWIVGEKLGDFQRTIGVNVDLFDIANNLVASDAFQGVIGGQAFSQILPVSLLPGAYSLRFSGTATLGSRYRVHLTTDETAPGFEPIVDAPPTGVPEPGTWALAGVALALLLSRAAARPSRTTRSR